MKIQFKNGVTAELYSESQDKEFAFANSTHLYGAERSYRIRFISNTDFYQNFKLHLTKEGEKIIRWRRTTQSIYSNAPNEIREVIESLLNYTENSDVQGSPPEEKQDFNFKNNEY